MHENVFALFHYNWFSPAMALVWGMLGLLGAAPTSAKQDAETGEALRANLRRGAWMLFMVLVVWGVASWFLFPAPVTGWSIWQLGVIRGLIAAGAAWTAGFGLRFLVMRFAAPWLSAWQRKWRNSQVGSRRRDMSDELGRYRTQDYDPARYFAKKPGDDLFIGLDEHGKPLYIPWEMFKETHGQVIGPTRFGKGVLLGIVMRQVIEAYGMGNWYFDPKQGGDRHAKAILAESAKRAGLPFVYIDLVNAIGSYSPFAGGTTAERAERLIAAFKLEDGGDISDFYKRTERSLCHATMEQVAASKSTPDKLLDRFTKLKLEEFSGDAKRSQEKMSFESGLEEWMKLPSLMENPKDSINVAELLRQRAVVYIGTGHKGIAPQAARTLLTELTDSAMADQPVDRGEHVFVCVDEARKMISEPIVSALTMVAGAGVSMWLAHQSIEDMLQLEDKRLVPKAVKSAVATNCQIKIIHAAGDIETAEYVAKLTGTQTGLQSQIEKVETGQFGGERWTKDRAFREVEEAVISTNTMLSLPPRVAAIRMPGHMPQLTHTAFVRYDAGPLKAHLEALAADGMD